MDVTVSALGDAKNLQGGTLLVTPLLGADGNVYAVAQGSVAIGGFQAEGEAAKIVRGVPTVGRIANGAIIEREIEFALNRLPNVRLALRNADFTTAKRIAAAVNDYLGAKTAEPIDPSTVQLSIPAGIQGQRRRLPDRDRAVAGRTGPRRQDRHRRTLRHHRDGPRRPRRHRRGRAGQSHRHDLRKPAGQPAQSAVARTHRGDAAHHASAVTEDGKKFALVKDGVSLQQLVDGLNGLGIGPRDLIGILQAIKAAGAIQADIEVM